MQPLEVASAGLAEHQDRFVQLRTAVASVQEQMSSERKGLATASTSRNAAKRPLKATRGAARKAGRIAQRAQGKVSTKVKPDVT